MPTPSRFASGANGRLTSVVRAGPTYAFTYSGLGDRVRHEVPNGARETVAGVPINYTLDLASGLTQVLSDGTSAYL
jgi:YD repeat-containing protein